MDRCWLQRVSDELSRSKRDILTPFAAADESLKFWKVFERKAGVTAAASREGGVGKGGAMAKQMTIR